jgi:transaldolase
LTISPALLEQLQNTEGKVEQKLFAEQARDKEIKKVSYINNEADFRYYFNEDPMAVDKLAEGIRYISSTFLRVSYAYNNRKFAADAVSLKGILKEKILAA